jgi:hypothetical protein
MNERTNEWRFWQWKVDELRISINFCVSLRFISNVLFHSRLNVILLWICSWTFKVLDNFNTNSQVLYMQRNFLQECVFSIVFMHSVLLRENIINFSHSILWELNRNFYCCCKPCSVWAPTKIVAVSNNYLFVQSSFETPTFWLLHLFWPPRCVTGGIMWRLVDSTIFTYFREPRAQSTFCTL